MEWEPWERTHDNCEEWTAWDETDVWFVSVHRERRRGLIWHWHMAYAPGDGEALFEENGWSLTKGRGLAAAKAAAERAKIRTGL